MIENDVNQALADCLSGPKGDAVLQWMVYQIRMCIPLSRGTSDGMTDSSQLHYLDGRIGAYLDLIERSGHRITYERTPENDDGQPDNYTDE